MLDKQAWPIYNHFGLKGAFTVYPPGYRVICAQAVQRRMYPIAKGLLLKGEAGMEALGRKLARALSAGDAVFLHGEMGMGKSVLARAIAREFGVEGPMPSPSFTILECYEADIPVKHFDLYRLEDRFEFYEAGLDEEMDPKSLSIVEWPEMTDYLPLRRIDVTITRGDAEDERLAEITAEGIPKENITKAGL